MSRSLRAQCRRRPPAPKSRVFPAASATRLSAPVARHVAWRSARVLALARFRMDPSLPVLAPLARNAPSVAPSATLDLAGRPTSCPAVDRAKLLRLRLGQDKTLVWVSRFRSGASCFSLLRLQQLWSQAATPPRLPFSARTIVITSPRRTQRSHRTSRLSVAHRRQPLLP